MGKNDKNVSFEPTATDLGFRDKYFELKSIDLSTTYKSVCIAYDLNEQWYYKRCHDCPAFKEWFQAAKTEFYGKELGDVHEAMKKRAVKGSSKDAKLFLERFDKEYQPKQIQKVEGNASFNIFVQDAIRKSKEIKD